MLPTSLSNVLKNLILSIITSCATLVLPVTFHAKKTQDRFPQETHSCERVNEFVFRLFKAKVLLITRTTQLVWCTRSVDRSAVNERITFIYIPVFESVTMVPLFIQSEVHSPTRQGKYGKCPSPKH